MTMPTKAQLQLAPWMGVARNELGVVESLGEENTARVLEYLGSCRGPRRMLQRDATSWCSAFVNFCMQQVALPSTRSLAARSWLLYGETVLRSDIAYGDIAILWRGVRVGPDVINAPGHVGFVHRWDESGLVLVGGNQGNKVSARSYPWSRLLGIRRPTAAALALRGISREA
jgi:uncharacterized protein (TIGR02594 family)